MLLSCVSYKIAVSRLLPTVSYLTSLDKYCISSLVIIAGMLGYHAVFGLFTSTFDIYLLKYFDRLFFIAFTALILFQQLVYVRWLIKISDVHEELIEKSIFYEVNSTNKGSILSGKKENWAKKYILLICFSLRGRHVFWLKKNVFLGENNLHVCARSEKIT